MSTKASVMQKYYIEAIQHQNEFPNEIWHFESQCIVHFLLQLDLSNAESFYQMKIVSKIPYKTFGCILVAALKSEKKEKMH